jgi:uncharacterized protein (UPF0261 family)
MPKSIAIIGTLDTKGDPVAYLKERIKEKGHRAVVIDVGILGESPYKADITRYQVAEAAGTTLDDIAALKDKEAAALEKMIQGAHKIAKELSQDGKLDGLLAVGGSMGTSLALRVIGGLPLGLPKIVISTVAYSPAISPELLGTDLLMMPWHGGLWGISEVSRRVLDLTVGMILGAAELYDPNPLTKRLIGVTALGSVSAKYMYHLKPALDERGYEVSVYHATGMNVKLLEKAIADGQIDAVLELQACKELIAEVCGSLFSPGPKRFEAAVEKGIPQVLSMGTIESCIWAPHHPIPPKYADRTIIPHNDVIWMVPTSVEEKVEAAKMMAEKLNRAKGPCAFLIPTGEPPAGIRKLGFEDPMGVAAFREELKKWLKPKVKVVEVASSSDDPQFTMEAVKLLDELLE